MSSQQYEVATWAEAEVTKADPPTEQDQTVQEDEQGGQPETEEQS